MNNQELIANQLLNTCIQIEEVRISRKLSIPCQIIFQFEPCTLNQLEQIRQRNHKLALKKSTLANLRYYALLTSFATQNSSDNFALALKRSPLTFSTIYPNTNNQKKIVIRSVINFEGQITQQIQADLWSNSQLLPKIIDLHHWLTFEVIAQLPLKQKYRFMRLLRILWIIVSTIVGFILWFYLPINILLKIILISLTIYLLFKYCKKPLKKYLKSQLLSCLIHSSWPNSTRKRQIAWNTLHALS